MGAEIKNARSSYIDNLKLCMIILVVVLHLTISYILIL